MAACRGSTRSTGAPERRGGALRGGRPLHSQVRGAGWAERERRHWLGLGEEPRWDSSLSVHRVVLRNVAAALRLGLLQ